MRRIQPFSTVFVFAIVGGVQLLGGLDVQGQEIPRDKYLQHLPLKYPTIVGQTKASVKMDLFGSPPGSEYRDMDLDGIDDCRHKVLLDLAVRFAPYLVLNSTLIPMDFRLFMEREEPFLLFVDTWDISGDPVEHVRCEKIDWNAPSGRLLSLLETFDPFVPGPAYRSGALTPKGAEHQVMYFNFPGEGEETWKQKYVDKKSEALPKSFEHFAKVFVHPFLESEKSRGTGHQGYAFILQYWFFYPYNDGVNNHEGDWEHINVSIRPLDKLDEPLSKADVRQILAGTAMDNLVIHQVDYYFHHKVMTLDYTCPNVYQSREKWKTECEKIREKRLGQGWVWKLVRIRAYRDKGETIINTHPIGFIGGDNKGTGQVLKSWGGVNRASNGTYPFSGLYNNIGLLGVAEQIPKRFDRQKHVAEGDHRRAVPEGGYRRGKVVSFASRDRIEIIPDGERVVNLVKANAQARRDWAWLVLPIRWGYPATESPLAGNIAHTDFGNVSVVGPSYNAGWNRSGAAPGFQVYSPYTFVSMFRLNWQEHFINNLGYLNPVVASLAMLPPFDAVWQTYRVGRQAYHSFGNTDEDYLVFKPNGPVPTRFMSWISLGRTSIVMSPGFADLVLHPKALNAVANRLANVLIQGEGLLVEKLPFVESAGMLQFEAALYFGERFATQSLIRFGNPMIVGYNFTLPATQEDFQLRGTLAFYEYSSSFRYNLKAGRFMIFAKSGYGLSRYRLTEISANDELLPDPGGPWINKPTLHFGGGIEWLPFPSRGTNLSIRGDALIYIHFSTDTKAIVLTPSGISMSRDSVTSPWLKRCVFTLALTYAL